MENVGLRIRLERERRGWSQRQLADKAGVHHTTITRIEGGESVGPRSTTVQLIARAMGLRVEDLINDAPPLNLEERIARLKAIHPQLSASFATDRSQDPETLEFLVRAIETYDAQK